MDNDDQELDLLDRRLVQALMLDGRAPFSRLATVLEVTDQTVVRRYRRLRGAGMLRVLGLPVGHRVGLFESRLRIQCAPGAAMPIADALARRPDTAWVKIYSSGTEVGCMIRSRSRDERDALLLQKLPRTQHVTAVSAHNLLHSYSGYPGRWLGAGALSDDQVRQLEHPPPTGEGRVRLDDEDHALLAALARDGRAGYPELARAAGRSESTVRRRMDHLRESGALYFDVEILPVHFGFEAEASLTATVAPSDLAEVGRTLAGHPEVAWAAATTGCSNLAATVLCRDLNDLYTYMTERLGALKAVRQLEVVPVLRPVKRAGLLTDGNRLYDPPPGPRS
ncbi:AsnC family transcriptional regulator [Streptomyces sp. NPDC026206]|uniref:Lrp/AsnC family transcriptional regulator n=1 Tax=Streptomyces sp. NPDC026206 TaxID=3157089 RepID=UPI0033E2FFC3